MNTKGIGLGLVISEKIVKMFNGSIELESEVNVGSEFTFTIQISPLNLDDNEDSIPEVN